jgi:flagellar biosynthesis/type III secretory pathway protein FliH
MATEPDLKREIADERRELTNAVAALREEIGEATERGKQIGIAAGTLIGATLALRTALKIRRRFRDS